MKVEMNVNNSQKSNQPSWHISLFGSWKKGQVTRRCSITLNTNTVKTSVRSAELQLTVGWQRNKLIQKHIRQRSANIVLSNHRISDKRKPAFGGCQKTTIASVDTLGGSMFEKQYLDEEVIFERDINSELFQYEVRSLTEAQISKYRTLQTVKDLSKLLAYESNASENLLSYQIALDEHLGLVPK